MANRQHRPQPDLSSREVPVLESEGIRFRDLNKNGQLDVYEDWRLPAEVRVEDLLNRLTLEEKAGLMMHPGLAMQEDGSLNEEDQGFIPPTTPTVLERKITHFNSWTAADPLTFATWNNNMQVLGERSRLGIPITLSTDPRNHYTHSPLEYMVQAAGYSLWPEPIGLAATRDVALVEEFARIAALEYRASGFRTALHPMADIATEPRWGRISGTFGEDAELVTQMTVAYIRGLQGEQLGPESVTAMTKHFPGGGPQWDGRDPHNMWGREQVYPGDNFDYHLIPFRAAIEAGTAQIMPYYGIPVGQTDEEVGMGFNKAIITGLLREKLGYDGVVCTDWGITNLMVWGMEFTSVRERYKKVIEAGCDQFGGASEPHHIVDLVRSGELSESRIDESVRRILRVTFTLGLFENPFVDLEQSRAIINNPEHQLKADLAQRKSIVLLKNGAEAQPLLPLANGIKLYLEDVSADVAREYGQIVATPEEADIAIVRVNAPHETGPGRFGGIPMGHLGFRGEQLAHLQKLCATVPTIIAVYLSRPAILTQLQGAAALLGTFGATDTALLDVLFGRFAPVGKLPFELPSSMDAVEAQYEDVPFDSTDPLYPYGYGLTY